jgi:hypothetical protein
MKKQVILYQPNGGKEGVTPHPSKIEEMKANGWIEKSDNKKVKVKENKDGKS